MASQQINTQGFMDQRLLNILVCPVSKVALTTLSSRQLTQLNAEIAAGRALSVDGLLIREPVQAALVTVDQKVVYRIEDDIPVLLPEEGIGTTQFRDFARA